MNRPIAGAAHRRTRSCILLLSLLIAWLMARPAWAGYAVSVVPIVRTQWQSHIRVLGEVRSLSRALLRAPVNGHLSRFSVPDGSHVRAGSYLGQVTPPGLAARISAARSRLRLSRQLLKRDRALYAQRLVTRSAVQRAGTRIAIDGDALKTLEFKRAQTQLVAPAGGTIHYLAAPGTEISAGTPVIRLGGAGVVWIRAFVPPSAAGLLRTGETAVLEGGGHRHRHARLMAVGDSARHDGLVEIFLRPASKGVLPGEWLWVNLPAVRGEAWRIPRPALVMRGARARIYVLRHHRAAVVPVSVVHVSRRYVWLHGPLHQGESVIVDGAGVVTDNTAVTVDAASRPPKA